MITMDNVAFNLAHAIGKTTMTATVHSFYEQVRAHPVLSVPFLRVHDWPTHLDKIVHFWWVGLGGERYLDYNYQMPTKHAEAGFTPDFYAIWIGLFESTLNANLPPELAQPWLARAQNIGRAMTMMHDSGQFEAMRQAMADESQHAALIKASGGLINISEPE